MESPCEFCIEPPGFVNHVNKPKGKRPLRRFRHRWEDNIRMGLKEIGVNIKNWIDSVQDEDD